MRARNIKPGFFTNELLAFANPLNQVIYCGLWCLADRKGVLEDRPQKIHMLVNPGRPYETTLEAIDWLVANAFLWRYEVHGKRYLKVVEFLKHQHPHHQERDSGLPDAPTPQTGAPVQQKQITDVHRDASPLNLGLKLDEPGMHPPPILDSPPDPGGSNPSDSGFLIPDSGYLIPDSPHLRVDARAPANTALLVELFGQVRRIYPAPAGRVDWITGQKNFNNRVLEGIEPQRLIDGAGRYADFVAAGGVSSNRYVMQPSKFFGDVDQPWAQAWDPPSERAKKSRFDQAMENLSGD